ncbi:hypothetical protein ACI0FM_04530, partial [Paenochrobactrum sp. BZR 588]
MIHPSHDCAICPRLHDFLQEWRIKEPEWHNAPVSPFMPVGGDDSVSLMIIGLDVVDGLLIRFCAIVWLFLKATKE